MIDDPIVAEVRKGREEHAARFNYDLEAIARDIRSREGKDGEKVVTLPPKPKSVAPRGTLPILFCGVLVPYAGCQVVGTAWAATTASAGVCQ